MAVAKENFFFHWLEQNCMPFFCFLLRDWAHAKEGSDKTPNPPPLTAGAMLIKNRNRKLGTLRELFWLSRAIYCSTVLCCDWLEQCENYCDWRWQYMYRLPRYRHTNLVVGSTWESSSQPLDPGGQQAVRLAGGQASPGDSCRSGPF